MLRTNLVLTLPIVLFANSWASALNIDYTDRGWYTPLGLHIPYSHNYFAANPPPANAIPHIKLRCNNFLAILRILGNS